MNREILTLLENDARLTSEQLGIMLGKDKQEIEKTVEELEKNGTILGYKTIIDWEKTEKESVTAMIEVKITPQRGRGFDSIAEKIYNYQRKYYHNTCGISYCGGVKRPTGICLECRYKRRRSFYNVRHKDIFT